MPAASDIQSAGLRLNAQQDISHRTCAGTRLSTIHQLRGLRQKYLLLPPTHCDLPESGL